MGHGYGFSLVIPYPETDRLVLPGREVVRNTSLTIYMRKSEADCPDQSGSQGHALLYTYPVRLGLVGGFRACHAGAGANDVPPWKSP